jgi:hypothetical protein
MGADATPRNPSKAFLKDSMIISQTPSWAKAMSAMAQAEVVINVLFGMDRFCCLKRNVMQLNARSNTATSFRS